MGKILATILNDHTIAIKRTLNNIQIEEKDRGIITEKKSEKMANNIE